MAKNKSKKSSVVSDGGSGADAPVTCNSELLAFCEKAVGSGKKLIRSASGYLMDPRVILEINKEDGKDPDRRADILRRVSDVWKEEEDWAAI